MVDSFTKLSRSAIEQLYDDVATIIGFENIKNPITKETISRTCILHQDVPCHVSFGRLNYASSNEPAEKYEQTITLFCSPDIDVPPGSRIEFTRGSKPYLFEASGNPAVYGSHQEVALIARDFA